MPGYEYNARGEHVGWLGGAYDERGRDRDGNSAPDCEDDCLLAALYYAACCCVFSAIWDCVKDCLSSCCDSMFHWCCDSREARFGHIKQGVVGEYVHFTDPRQLDGHSYPNTFLKAQIVLGNVLALDAAVSRNHEGKGQFYSVVKEKYGLLDIEPMCKVMCFDSSSIHSESPEEAMARYFKYASHMADARGMRSANPERAHAPYYTMGQHAKLKAWHEIVERDGKVPEDMAKSYHCWYDCIVRACGIPCCSDYQAADFAFCGKGMVGAAFCSDRTDAECCFTGESPAITSCFPCTDHC